MIVGRPWLKAIVLVLCCATTAFAAGTGEQESDQSVPAGADPGRPQWLVEEGDDYVTIVDSFGNTVTVDKPISSMVSNGMGSAFAAVRALEAEDKVGASSEYVRRNSVFFPRLSTLPSISSGLNVDNELVIELGPSFILTSPFTVQQFSEPVRNTIPIVQLKFSSTDDYLILGKLLGREAEAKAFVDWIEGYARVIDERVASLAPEEYKEVFIYYGGEYGMSPPPPYGTFGSDNALRNDLIRRAGGKSMSESIPGEWITVDAEWIVQRNPSLVIREVYIINDAPEMGYGVNGYERVRELMNAMMNEPAFESSAAVRSKQVHAIYGDIVTDSWFISLVYFAKWLHPELFKDMDPEVMHQEYLSRFQKLDFDVRKQGVFAYSME